MLLLKRERIYRVLQKETEFPNRNQLGLDDLDSWNFIR